MDAALHARLTSAGYRLDFGHDDTGVYGKSFRQGGGFYITGSSTEVTLTNCNIYSNEATGYVSTCAKTRARHQNPSTCHFPELSPIAPPELTLPVNLCQPPHTFLEPSECERHSSGRAAASTSRTATWCSPTATSTRTRRNM